MNYELAKELKDAGYPLETLGEVQIPDEETLHAFLEDGTWYLKPDLSSLIEACGEEFFLLKRVSDNEYAGNRWKASTFPNDSATKDEDMKWDTWFGKTPEEAVARLWLALNKHE